VKCPEVKTVATRLVLPYTFHVLSN